MSWINHLPENARPIAQKLHQQYPVRIKVSKPRKTKLGDYRNDLSKPALITVNADLNPWAFLITFLHEYAHHFTVINYGWEVAPHGSEWKNYYHRLLKHFQQREVFPPELRPAIQRHLSNPASSSCYDLNLMRELRKYDPPNKTQLPLLENLPQNTRFLFGNEGRLFIKQQKLRKRYRCTEVSSGRIFLFSPMAEVKPVKSTP